MKAARGRDGSRAVPRIAWDDYAIIIASPGEFRIPVSEAMKPSNSDPRNETMMKMLAKIEIGERAGGGMDKIIAGLGLTGYEKPRYAVAFGPNRTTLTMLLTYVSGVSTDRNELER